MSDVLRPMVDVWVPEVLDGKPRRPGWLTTRRPARSIPTIDLRDRNERTTRSNSSGETIIDLDSAGDETGYLSDESHDLRDLKEQAKPSATWLTDIVRRSIDRDLSIRTVIDLGRGLEAENVLRLRALHKGSQIRPELRWEGSDILVGEQLTKIAHTQRTLLGRDGGVNDLRFRMRIQGIGLEDALLGYVATELIDPVIMDSTLSLDVLCHADLGMTADVILRLGLARAHHDEVAQAVRRHSFRNDALWSMIEQTWLDEMAMARGVARRWAESVIRRGRSDVAGSGVSVRL